MTPRPLIRGECVTHTFVVSQFWYNANMKKISRGDFIANAAAGLLAVPAFGLFAAAPAAKGPLKGTVRDTAGRGMAGVVVSDGLVCVRTDDAGRFTLPAAHDYARFVFVSTPTGAWFPTGAFWQPIVADKTEGYDFVLKRRKETDARGGHRFIHFSDSEIGEINETEERWRDELKAFAASDGAAFIVHTGDICYHAGLVSHIKLMNTTNMGLPVYYTVGNHDLVREGGYGEYLFESLYGPSCYSFNAGGVHYVVTPMRSGDARPSYTTERVAAWLKNDLALIPRGTPVIGFNHDLLSGDGRMKYGDVDLVAANLKAWCYGHWHLNFVRRQGTWTSVCTSQPNKGGIEQAMAGWRVVHVDPKGEVRSEMRVSFVDDSLAVVAATGSRLAVNAYRSAGRTTGVAYAVSAGGREIARGKMRQRTDWTWEAKVPKLPKDAKVSLQARFADGGSRTATASALDERLVASANAGGNLFWCPPIAAKGVVYAGIDDEGLSANSGVVAFSGDLGRELWRFRSANAVRNSIALDGETLFAQDVEGNLTALDARSGKVLWQKHLSIGGGTALPNLGQGLAASDGVVYAGEGKCLTAIRADGTVLWSNGGYGPGEGHNASLAVGGNVVIGSCNWKGIFANDRASGKRLWAMTGRPWRHRASTARIVGERTYLVSTDTVAIVETATGKTIRERRLAAKGPAGMGPMDVATTPLVTDRLMVFGTIGLGLVALDRETLEDVWSVPVGTALAYTPEYLSAPASIVSVAPVLAGGEIWFGASDGVVRAVDPATGRVTYSRALGAPVLSAAAVGEGVVYVADFGGNLTSFSIRS